MEQQKHINKPARDAPCGQTSTGSPKPTSAGLQVRTPSSPAVWVQSACSYLLRISNEDQEPCLLPNNQWHAGPKSSTRCGRVLDSSAELKPKMVLGTKDILPECSSEPSVLLARADSTLPSNPVLFSTGFL